MRLADIGQLAVTVKESLKTLAIDNYTKDDEKASPIQNRYVDSVELSDRAIELSIQADTETGIEKKPDSGFINKGQEEVPAANPLQEVFTKALAFNALA
jgi:hypothetical protein